MSSETTDMMDSAVAMMDENSSPNPQGGGKKRAAPQSKPSPGGGKRARTDDADPTITKSEYLKVQAMTSADFNKRDAADLKEVAKRLKLGHMRNMKESVYAITKYFSFVRAGTKSAPSFLPETSDNIEENAHAIPSHEAASSQGSQTNDNDAAESPFIYGSAAWNEKVRTQGTLSRAQAESIFGAPVEVDIEGFTGLVIARDSGDWASGFTGIKAVKGKKGMFVDDFFFVRDLDTGSKCDVRAAVHKSSGTVVAVKVIPREDLEDRDAAIMFRREVETQCRIRGSHVVAAYGWFSEGDKVYVVQELCANGNLFRALVKTPDAAFPMARLANIFRQLTLGLMTIHGAGVLHRGLSLENILLDHNDVVKITDFGHCACNTKGGRFSNGGQSLYSAPEKVDGNPHWISADLWDLGIVFYALLMEGYGPPKKNNHVMLPVEFPVTMSANAADLVRKLLVHKEEARLPLCDVESHPFVAMGF